VETYYQRLLNRDDRNVVIDSESNSETEVYQEAQEAIVQACRDPLSDVGDATVAGRDPVKCVPDPDTAVCGVYIQIRIRIGFRTWITTLNMDEPGNAANHGSPTVKL